jgi:hypothetical protein
MSGAQGGGLDLRMRGLHDEFTPAVNWLVPNQVFRDQLVYKRTRIIRHELKPPECPGYLVSGP